MDAARGETLVRETGIYQQPKMIDSGDVVAWLTVNREHCSRHGSCPGGCVQEMVRHETHGYAVCPKTYEPCGRQRLALIIQNLERINGTGNRQ